MTDIQTHFRALSNGEGIPDDHVRYLRGLRDRGVNPGVIYDIGSCVLHWTKVAHEIWPEAMVIAFDALEETEFLHSEYKAQHPDKFDYFHAILSDRDNGAVFWHENLQFPSGSSYYREIGTDVYRTSVGRIRPTRMLDSIVREKEFPPADLVKIDVQGAELDVLYGGTESMSKATDLVVELQSRRYNEGATLVGQSRPIIEGMGWTIQSRGAFSRGIPDGDYHFSRVVG